MKQYVKQFFFRGLVACWGGPVILAIIYGILGATGTVTTLTTVEVCKGVLTITLMTFLAAGVTVVYQIEELPLFPAILLHGLVLYLDYVMIYLVNGWLAEGKGPFLVFTGIFVVGFALVWLVVYLLTFRSTQRLNRNMRQ